MLQCVRVKIYNFKVLRIYKYFHSFLNMNKNKKRVLHTDSEDDNNNVRNEDLPTRIADSMAWIR